MDEDVDIRKSSGSPRGPAVAAGKQACIVFSTAHTHTAYSSKAPQGTTIVHLLKKAGDVVFAAGRPGERVGVGCNVGGHQFGSLVTFGTTGIPIPIMVHPETERHKIKNWNQSSRVCRPSVTPSPLRVDSPGCRLGGGGVCLSGPGCKDGTLWL